MEADEPAAIGPRLEEGKAESPVQQSALNNETGDRRGFKAIKTPTDIQRERPGQEEAAARKGETMKKLAILSAFLLALTLMAPSRASAADSKRGPAQDNIYKYSRTDRDKPGYRPERLVRKRADARRKPAYGSHAAVREQKPACGSKSAAASRKPAYGNKNADGREAKTPAQEAEVALRREAGQKRGQAPLLE